jgi:hypothetical protein
MKIMDHIKKYKEYLNNNFWKWFGDSKVVDEHGNPLIVHHGTPSTFDIFKPSKSVGTHGETDQIEGMYFTDNIDGASFFSLIDNDSRYLKSVYLSLQNPYITEGISELKEELKINKLSEVSNKLKTLGYDGIIIERGFYAKGGPYKKFIAFNSNQIKSATDNNGNFSLNNKSILENNKNLNNNFWKWFGDSKVVDEHGKPQIVYHGTYGDFDDFKNPIKAVTTNIKTEQPIFFTTDIDTATSYSIAKNGSIMPCYIRITKPFSYNTLSEEEVDNYENYIYDKLKEKDNVDDLVYHWMYQFRIGSWGIMEDPNTIEFAKNNNYDGIITKEMGATNFGVFNPNQIKSATANNGNFDINKNSILENKNG